MAGKRSAISLRYSTAAGALKMAQCVWVNPNLMDVSPFDRIFSNCLLKSLYVSGANIRLKFCIEVLQKQPNIYSMILVFKMGGNNPFDLKHRRHQMMRNGKLIIRFIFLHRYPRSYGTAFSQGPENAISDYSFFPPCFKPFLWLNAKFSESAFLCFPPYSIVLQRGPVPARILRGTVSMRPER